MRHVFSKLWAIEAPIWKTVFYVRWSRPFTQSPITHHDIIMNFNSDFWKVSNFETTYNRSNWRSGFLIFIPTPLSFRLSTCTVQKEFYLNISEILSSKWCYQLKINLIYTISANSRALHEIVKSNLAINEFAKTNYSRRIGIICEIL